MKISEFRKMIHEIIEQELTEMTTTSAAPCPATKFAFAKNKNRMKEIAKDKGKYTIVKDDPADSDSPNLQEHVGSTTLAPAPATKMAYDSNRAMRRALAEDKGKYTIIWDDAEDADDYARHALNENRYLTLKRDEAHTPRQKIGIAISEVNKRLMEIEDILRFHSRLKIETGLQSGNYWARTHKALIRIESHMTKLSNRIKTMRS